MSYARRWPGVSDVYVYPHAHGYFSCNNCSLGTDPKTPTASVMADHLRRHVQQGDLVPEGTIEEILEDGDAVGWGEKYLLGSMVDRLSRSD